MPSNGDILNYGPTLILKNRDIEVLTTISIIYSINI